MAYPTSFTITRKGFQWLSPPPLGRSLFVLGYCILITVMLTTNSILPSSNPNYLEKLGFRGAWMSVMQVPLTIVLAGKVNVVSLLTGISYERLNWLHRCISRVLLVAVAVHAGFFLREWGRAGILGELFTIMPIVQYGAIAGGLLLWMNLSGLAPVRHAFYEFWVIQHLASIGAFLWAIYRHIPPYARFYFWMSLAFIVFDRGCRLIWTTYRNIKLRSRGNALMLADRIGYRTELHALPGETTRVVIKNIPFTWTPGQHVYIWIPRIGLLETHPFTISNISNDILPSLPSAHGTQIAGATRNAVLEVRAHSGFSRRLLRLATRKAVADKPYEVRSFIQGPYGLHPEWNTYESVVLISASTGASFTLPILESILADPCCVRRCHFILLVRRAPQCSCYLHRLRVAARSHKHANLVVTIHVAVTGTNDDDDEEGRIEGELQGRCCCGPEKAASGCMCGSEEAAKSEKAHIYTRSLSGDDSSSDHVPEQGTCCASTILKEEPRSCCEPESKMKMPVLEDMSTEKSSKLNPSVVPMVAVSTPSTRDVHIMARRPMLSQTIRTTVEEARGETCVVVCGGKSLSSTVRNEVARLSDERAVHKGTGAQGIKLWVEEFGF